MQIYLHKKQKKYFCWQNKKRLTIYRQALFRSFYFRLRFYSVALWTRRVQDAVPDVDKVVGYTL